MKGKKIVLAGISLLSVFSLLSFAEAKPRKKARPVFNRVAAKSPPQLSGRSVSPRKGLSTGLKMMYDSRGRSDLSYVRIRGLRKDNTAVNRLTLGTSQVRRGLRRQGAAGKTTHGDTKLSHRRLGFHKVANPRTATQQWRDSRRFLDRAIARGDNFRLSTHFKNRLDREGKSTDFSRKIGYLLHRGYRPTPDGYRMVRPRVEASKVQPTLTLPGRTFKPPGM